MTSEFGIYMREIRKKTNESLRTMAKNLEVSAAFLSSMEVGKRKVPSEIVNKISNIYNFTEDEKKELEDIASKTNSKITIDLNELSEEEKEVSLVFARKIKQADGDLLKKLKEALNNEKN